MSECTIVISDHCGSIRTTFMDKTIVLPRKLVTGSIYDFLFCYCPLVSILFELQTILRNFKTPICKYLLIWLWHSHWVLPLISIYRMKIHLAVAKLVYFLLCWCLRLSLIFQIMTTCYDVIFKRNLWQAPYHFYCY